MDGQEYLNQIAESSQPVSKVAGKKSGIAGILQSKFLKIGVIGIGLLILIIIIGSILGSNKGSEQTLSYELKLHLDNTAEVVSEYQQYVKSSTLRSDSASFQGVLSNTSNELKSYLEDKYDFKDKDIGKGMQEEAKLVKDDLSNELFEAKINGILDRIYAHKMAYEISLITSEETKLMKSSDSEMLTKLLNTSYESLSNLYDRFDNFSETNN